jgi:hypothetical protein
MNRLYTNQEWDSCYNNQQQIWGHAYSFLEYAYKIFNAYILYTSASGACERRQYKILTGGLYSKNRHKNDFLVNCYLWLLCLFRAYIIVVKKMNGKCYYKYPLHTLEDLGLSSGDDIPPENWWKHARQLTAHENNLIQSGYVWMQTGKDYLDFPFPPPPVKASYSELWFILKTLHCEINNAVPYLTFGFELKHKDRYNAENQAYSYQQMIKKYEKIGLLREVICRCAEVELDLLKLKKHAPLAPP